MPVENTMAEGAECPVLFFDQICLGATLLYQGGQFLYRLGLFLMCRQDWDDYLSFGGCVGQRTS